jgi:hypothetical protein
LLERSKAPFSNKKTASLILHARKGSSGYFFYTKPDLTIPI